MRGLATEFGITVPKGIRKLDELMTLVDTDESIPKQAKQASWRDMAGSLMAPHGSRRVFWIWQRRCLRIMR